MSLACGEANVVSGLQSSVFHWFVQLSGVADWLRSA